MEKNLYKRCKYLTNEDVDMINSWTHFDGPATAQSDKEIYQLDRAWKITKYEMELEDGKWKRISRKKALEILGRAEVINGLCRSAFHCTAIRGDKIKVFFNSREIFRDEGGDLSEYYIEAPIEEMKELGFSNEEIEEIHNMKR